MYQRIQAFATRLLANPLIRRVVKNSAYLFSATGVSAALSMLQGILAARLLGVEQFGVLGAITLFTSVINKLISFRMNELVIKYVGDYTARNDTRRAAAVYKVASLTEAVSSLIAFALFVVLAPLGAQLFAKNPATRDWFLIYGVIILGNLFFESSLGLLQYFDQFSRIAKIQIAQSAFTLFLIVIVFLLRGGVIEVLVAYMLGKILYAGLISAYALLEAHRQWGRGWWRARLSLLKDQRRDLARFAISTNLSASINLVNKDSELLWVSALRTPVEAGYYKLALALANIALLPVAPLPQATYPELSRESAQGNWDNVRYVLRQGSRLGFLYTSMVVAGLIFLGNWVIRTFYGAEFLPAYPALIIMLFGFLIANTFYWNRTALLALNRPDYPTKVNLSAALVKIVLALLLIPRYGYIASAGLLAGYYAFSIGLNVRKVYRELDAKQFA